MVLKRRTLNRQTFPRWREFNACTHGSCPTVELLEDRLLLAVDFSEADGTLLVTGSAREDTILIRTVSGDEQQLEVFVNGVQEFSGLLEALVGGIEVRGLAGHDTLIVDYETGFDPVPSGGVFFQGGIPEGGSGVGDTLSILTGGRSVQLQHEQSDLDAGLFIVGAASTVSFDGVERTLVDTIDYVRPDRFEVNDSIASASVVGLDSAATLDALTIHGLGNGQSETDFFRVFPNVTGLLEIDSLFDHAQGDLDLLVLDSRGLVTASSQSQSDNERIVIPVVTNESYLVQVLGVGGAVNSYSLILNTVAAAEPQAVILNSQSDTGTHSNDQITAETTPIFTIQADASAFVNEGIPILSADDAEARSSSGAAVFVTIRESNSGTIDSGYASPISEDLFQFKPATPLTDGLMIVSASLHVLDARQQLQANEQITADPALGISPPSAPLTVLIDTIRPEVTSPQMLPSSDSGMSRSDNVTHIQQPAFVGVAGPGDQVRILANGLLVGETVAGTDGRWEVTVEPLTDGIHVMSSQVQDLAGNAGESSIIRFIEIDTIAPNTPLLDLTAESDTGTSVTDGITSVGTPTVTLTTTDLNSDDHLNDFNFKFRLYDRAEGQEEVLIYSSTDDESIPAENRQGGFTNLQFITTTLGQLAEGTHNLKLEVEDRAGNISEDFLLGLTVDTVLETLTSEVQIDLMEFSDTGMDDRDDVTRIHTPSFGGVAEVGAAVSVFANGRLVGAGTVGADQTDFVPGNGLGSWEVTTEPLDDGVYELIAQVEDPAGNLMRSESITVEIDSTAPNTPHLDLLNDTGHSRHDNLTRDSLLTFHMTTEDPSPAGGHLNRFNYKYRIFARLEGQAESLAYNSVTDTNLDLANLSEGFTDLRQLQSLIGPFPDGIHSFKLEVEDRAGNISHDVVLDVEIDSTLTDDASIQLLTASDSGMSSSDRVTSLTQPAFGGLAPVGATVRLLANGEWVGTAEAGSDESDGELENGMGIWEITSEPLKDDVYTITATHEDWAGNVGQTEELTIEIDSTAPNTPFLDLLEQSDSGRHDDDNITNVDVLRFSATTTDPNRAKHEILFPGGEHLKYRLFVRPESGTEMLVYDSSSDADLAAAAVDGLVSLNQVTIVAEDLPEGLHNFKLEVEDRAGNISADFLQNVLIDRTPFAGTVAVSSAGDLSFSPTLVGTGEANNIVSVLMGDTVIGTTVILPVDGDDAFRTGTWRVKPIVAIGGTYSLVVRFEDPAGNRADQEITGETDNNNGGRGDNLGPRIENVTRVDTSRTSLFDLKPAGGPDPLIRSILVHFSDGPARSDDNLHSAVLDTLATEEGNYHLVGDANGVIPIRNVTIASEDEGPGIATTAIQLDFGIALPDDRYTLSVSQRITDPAGNPLDGESGGSGPFVGNNGLSATPPVFPSGDGNRGGDFVARFTVDSRPELAVWSGGSVYVDTNGNFLFDPRNQDFVNRDIVYALGFSSDDIFVGNFAGEGLADGYDKLAAYGRFGGWVDGTFRWLIDFNNDGVPDIDVEDPADVNGLPVAGDFDGQRANGDEVALYTGSKWHFDTDHDFRVDTVLSSQLIGYPAIGDFDGDGWDDLVTWADDKVMVDLAGGVSNGWDGVADATFRFGFIGIRERPVAADLDQDGFADFGLWVPDRGGITPRASGEWYWLISGGTSLLERIVPAIDPVYGQTEEIRFTPEPFGNDIFAQFGDEFSIPVVGNFDPPSLSLTSRPRSLTNASNPLDVTGDGVVSPRDALITINHLNEFGPSGIDQLQQPSDFFMMDTNGDGILSAIDVLRVVNYLNDPVPLEDVDDGLAEQVAVELIAALTVADQDEEDEP